MKNKHTQGWGVGVLTQSSTINYTKKLCQLLNEGGGMDIRLMTQL